MPAAKLVVIYPVPTDLEKFERLYLDQHVPMAVAKLAGKTKIVATKVLSSVQGGTAPFHRSAETHFPSMSDLQTCAASKGTQETIANAISISSGGPPIFIVQKHNDENGEYSRDGSDANYSDNCGVEGPNYGRGLHVRFAPVRIAALLCHRKPFDCRRALRRSQPRTSGDHALSRQIGNKAACGRRIVIARWSSLPKHPDRAW